MITKGQHVKFYRRHDKANQLEGTVVSALNDSILVKLATGTLVEASPSDCTVIEEASNGEKETATAEEERAVPQT